jgi:hypothetical protein
MMQTALRDELKGTTIDSSGPVKDFQYTDLSLDNTRPHYTDI